MADDFLPTILGAVIAGLVGVIAVFTQQWLANRQWVRDQILGPTYNYVRQITDNPTARGWGPNPWDKVGWYDRMKVRRGLRVQIDHLSSVVEGYYTALTNFDNHLDQEREADRPVVRLHREMKALFGLTTDDDRLLWSRFGVEGRGYWYLSEFRDAVLRSITRNPTTPEAAWREVERMGPGRWNVVLETIRRETPGRLEGLYRFVVEDPTFQRSVELLRTADEWSAAAIERAWILRTALEPRT